MNEVLGLGDSLLVTVVGLAIVFLGLTILIFLIKALILLTQRMQSRNQAASAAPAPVPSAAPVQEAAVQQEVGEEEDEGELIAVITAAIACMLTEEKGFTVRRIRRVENSSSWQRAGREEQTYSHY